MIDETKLTDRYRVFSVDGLLHVAAVKGVLGMIAAVTGVGGVGRWLMCFLLGLSVVGSPQVLAQLTVEDAYVRGLPPGQSVTAAYMSLHNSSSAPLRIMQASTSLADSVEFHGHSHDDGVMRMRRQASLQVPAEGVLRLEPGHLHMMLLGLQRPLSDGEMVPLRLCGEGFPCLDLQVPVVSVLRE